MALSAFAVAAPGLEPLTAGELRQLGVTRPTVDTGGVRFTASPASLATVLLGSRIATRVIVRAAEFRATSFSLLEKRARSVPWDTWLNAGARVRFRVTCRKSRLYHSDAVAERLASSVSAAIPGAEILDGAGDDDGADDAQLLVVRVAHDVCTISVDAAGAALHRRGYRQAVGKAPLRETLAAAVVMSGIGGAGAAIGAVCDPFCGSGSIVIEAAMIARGIAPGSRRSFAAERWPTSDAGVWREARALATAGVSDALLPPMVGTDRDEGAIAAALANAERAGVGDDVNFSVASVSDAVAPAARGLLASNPPYGVRTGDNATLRNLYARLGAVARREFAGWRVAILSADRSPGHVLERQLGLKLSPAWRSTNGGIPVRLLAGDV